MADKQRTVVRKYFSKRKNEWVTKTYHYKRKKAKRSDLIIGRTGKIYEDRLKRLRDSLSDPNDQYELDLLIENQLYKKDARISERTLRSMLADSKIEKAIINTGYTADELASELEIDVADLLDEDNWSGSEFSFGGKTWNFEFKYDGSVMTVIKNKKKKNNK